MATPRRTVRDALIENDEGGWTGRDILQGSPPPDITGWATLHGKFGLLVVKDTGEWIYNLYGERR